MCQRPGHLHPPSRDPLPLGENHNSLGTGNSEGSLQGIFIGEGIPAGLGRGTQPRGFVKHGEAALAQFPEGSPKSMDPA